MADNNIFSGLEKVGLGMFSNMNLYEDETGTTAVAAEVAKKQEEDKKTKEKDAIFEKSFRCPVCDNEFKAKAIKAGKARMAGSDMDLRPKYEDIDPLKYDAICCPHCGYAALSRFFLHVSPAQIKYIRTNITPFFKGIDDKDDIYSYDSAITRHELALANAVVKKAKTSEKAYTCLKLAWLKRGKAEKLPADTKDLEKVKTKLKNEEVAYIKKAYEGFIVAMSKEAFPICGMDEWTYIYLVSELAYECEDYVKSLKLLSDLVGSKNASPKLKDKARELRKLMHNKV